EVERETGADHRGRDPREARSGRDERDDRRRLSGRVTQHREPPEQMKTHHCSNVSRSHMIRMMQLDRVRARLPLGNGGSGELYALPLLEKEGFGPLGRLPVSVRIVLESLVRNCDGKRVKEDDVRALASWKPRAERTAEVPFVVARIVLQDFTGVPLLVDLAAMRSAVQRLNRDPAVIEPLVPVALGVD